MPELETPRGHTLVTFVVTLADGTQGYLQVCTNIDGTGQEMYTAAHHTARRFVGCAKLEPHSSTFVFERIAPDA